MYVMNKQFFIQEAECNLDTLFEISAMTTLVDTVKQSAEH